MAAPGQAKMLAMSPSVSASVHFLEILSSIFCCSVASLPAVLVSVGGTSAEAVPVKEPRQTGARLPAVPSLPWFFRHLVAMPRALVKNLVPLLLISLTQPARSEPVSIQASVVAPCVTALTRSLTTLCCDNMQLEMTASSVSSAYDELRPPWTVSSPHAVAIFPAALVKAASILV